MNHKNTETILTFKECKTIHPAITKNPSPIKETLSFASEEEKIAFIADKFRDIMLALGLDLEDDSLHRTPERVAKMYVKEIFSGLKMENFPEMTFMEEQIVSSSRANMVFVNVHFISFCEHHFVPMAGKAYVAYIPKTKLIGLSKIPRIVRYFAKRPQLQERLTAQIADSLEMLVETSDIAVTLKAQHYCVLSRGVEDQNGHTITHDLRGDFGKEGPTRQEFFDTLNFS